MDVQRVEALPGWVDGLGAWDRLVEVVDRLRAEVDEGRR